MGPSQDWFFICLVTAAAKSEPVGLENDGNRVVSFQTSTGFFFFNVHCSRTELSKILIRKELVVLLR